MISIKNKKKSKGLGSIKIAVTVFAIVAVVTAVTFQYIRAVWDEKTAVHINPTTVENSTLAIGTHLIYLGALTQQIYDTAQDSTDESGQNAVYYKSELGGGQWFNITDASSLDDITSKGTPVDSTVIAKLYFTHWTKSDGKTYDLRTNTKVSIQNIKSPYKLEEMDELMPLETRYQLIKQDSAHDSTAKVSRIDQFWQTTVKNSVTNDCDAQLAALQKYYDVLCDNKGTKDQMSTVQEVMDAVDATRRAQVFDILNKALNSYSVELAQASDADTSLESAVNDSLTNVSDALTEYQGKMLADGTTIMAKVKYSVSTKLITDAKAINHAACDVDVAELIALSNIINGVVADKETEMSFLDSTLLPQATTQYLDGLKAGESGEYTAAVAANSSKALLNSLADNNESTLNAYRNELESYITAKCLRLDNTSAKSFINDRLSQASEYSVTVILDNFASGANETIDEHIKFLSDKLRELELAAGGNQLDKLNAKKEELKTKYMSALDKNDLATANSLESQINALDEQIQSLEDAQNNKLSSLQSQLDDLNKKKEAAQSSGNADESAKLDSEIAKLKAEISTQESGMTEGTTASSVAALKAECLDIINGGESNPDNLSKDISALSQLADLNAKAAFQALKDIYNAMVEQRDLKNNESYDDAIAAIEKTILEKQDAYAAAMRSELKAADFEKIAASYVSGESRTLEVGSSLTGQGNSDVTKLDSDNKALVYILALKMYYDQTKSDAALALMASKTQAQVNMASPYVFKTVPDNSAEYLPVTAVAKCSGLRYIWSENLMQATLAKGGDYYVFTQYSNQVRRDTAGDKTELLTTSAKYQSVLYIPDDYTYKNFGIEAVYITGIQYGVVSSDSLNGFAVQLLNSFLAEAMSKTAS